MFYSANGQFTEKNNNIEHFQSSTINSTSHLLEVKFEHDPINKGILYLRATPLLCNTINTKRAQKVNKKLFIFGAQMRLLNSLNQNIELGTIFKSGHNKRNDGFDIDVFTARGFDFIELECNTWVPIFKDIILEQNTTGTGLYNVPNIIITNLITFHLKDMVNETTFTINTPQGPITHNTYQEFLSNLTSFHIEQNFLLFNNSALESQINTLDSVQTSSNVSAPINHNNYKKYFSFQCGNGTSPSTLNNALNFDVCSSNGIEISLDQNNNEPISHNTISIEKTPTELQSLKNLIVQKLITLGQNDPSLDIRPPRRPNIGNNILHKIINNDDYVNTVFNNNAITNEISNLFNSNSLSSKKELKKMVLEYFNIKYAIKLWDDIYNKSQFLSSNPQSKKEMLYLKKITNNTTYNKISTYNLLIDLLLAVNI